MLGTLTIPSGSSLRLSLKPTRSDLRMQFLSNRPVTCAAVAPELERRRYGRPPGSLYEVLQVKHDASIGEIKTAYRSLAKLYHPDVSAEEMDGKEFIEIHEAYEKLVDPESRAEYDLTLRLNLFARRKPIMRYQSATDYVRARARNGFYSTRRWETDQCW